MLVSHMVLRRVLCYKWKYRNKKNMFVLLNQTPENVLGTGLLPCAQAKIFVLISRKKLQYRFQKCAYYCYKESGNYRWIQKIMEEQSTVIYSVIFRNKNSLCIPIRNAFNCNINLRLQMTFTV